jgi:hypothetical protein
MLRFSKSKRQSTYSARTLGSRDHAGWGGRRVPASNLDQRRADDDLPGAEPLFDAMKRVAKEQFGKSDTEAAEKFNALRNWLKHPSPHLPANMEVTNWAASTMLARAIGAASAPPHEVGVFP